ncbi:MAG: DNA internalization-related competence protein ComEC/Rec2 [Gudongella sp.]|nr:DNA internalization-related competence protein ComEC/Rec2 [Gudongella sp.]
MKRPALIPALFLTLGILIAYYFSISSTATIFLSLFVLTICIGCIYAGRKTGRLLMLLLFLLSILYTNYRHMSLLEKYYNQDVYILGTVHKEYKREGYNTYDIVMENINGEGIREKVRTNIYDGTPMYPGTRVIFHGQLHKPMENTNPKLFNHRQYLLTKNIKYMLRTEDHSTQNINGTIELGYEMQNSFRGRLDEIYDNGLSRDNAGFIKALLTGDKDSLQQEEYGLYKEMGIAHILAISGLHIGILTAFILFLMSRIGIKRNLAIPVALLFIWGFTYLVGFPESALRASVMLTFVLISKILHRPYDPVNILAASYIICLMINPFWIFSIGFQLSYGATLSLVALAPWIIRRVYPARGRIAMSMASVISVNIGILPLQSYYFNQLPIMTLLSNLLIVPVATGNLILGFITIAVPSLTPILDWLLDIQRLMIDLLSFLKIEALRVASPNLHGIVLYFFILIVAIRWRDISYLDMRMRKVIVVYLLFVSAIGMVKNLEAPNTEIHFIDVGQGDSALIRVEGRDYLIDTGGSIFGSFDPGESITLPYLQKLGVKRLDGVFISHFHEDHYKGLLPIIDDLKIDALYINKTIPDMDLKLELKRKNVPVLMLMEGSGINLSDNSSIECIFSSGGSYINENNNSLVLLLKSKGRSALFTGDIEAEVEERIPEYDVDILKVAHHGSSTSSSENHISGLMPEISVISAGRDNPYGHPHELVLETLHKVGSKVYRTDEVGQILVVISDEGMDVLPYYGPLYQADLMGFLNNHGYWLSWMFVYCILSYISILTYVKMEENHYEIH